MINKMHKMGGQAALILILLAAAALIFLAITYNWGNIAQTKVIISVAADEAASQLASDAASYGEDQKQTYLNDTNQVKAQTGILLAIILIVLAIILLPFAFAAGMALIGILSVVFAVVNVALQVLVIQPMISRLWNSMQTNQPVTQQFYEGGVATALQGSIQDQVNVTDYLDWNVNGRFGLNPSGLASDNVSRFALYYSDRLKMLNQNLPPFNPQVQLFYNELNSFVNGETCTQNETDYKNDPGAVTLNPYCAALGATYCLNNTTDPACTMKIPGSFQLSDTCTGSDPSNTATYSPYCDPCCQSGSSTLCASGGSSNCSINNPYGSKYPYLYDPSFQNYGSNVSFLEQFGRDQQKGPFKTMSPEVIFPATLTTPATEFPDGIYPFFWLMDSYSPQVSNINPNNGLNQSQYHWCTSNAPHGRGVSTPTGFSDLGQLSLPYACQGQDCCVNYIPSGVSGTVPAGSGTGYLETDVFGTNNIAQNSAFGDSSDPQWTPGDNQMCLTTAPYNGAGSTSADGTCEWTNSANPPPPVTNATVDSLDDTMHTLSDFVKFAQSVLSNNPGSLSTNFSTWYSEAAAWIGSTSTPQCSGTLGVCGGAPCSTGTTCTSGNGRLLSIYNPSTGTDVLGDWKTLISNWLTTNYTNSSALCVPPESTLLGEAQGSTQEDNAIKANGATWGSLLSVINCLNWNATTPMYNYEQCLSALTAAACPAGLPSQCAPNVLGRALTESYPPAYDGCAGNYLQWVNNNITLYTDEAPKFTLRAQFLNDIYNRASAMPTIFGNGEAALKQFLAACSGTNCTDGGPAAQLNNASAATPPEANLPNSVIYGWVDNPVAGHGGYAHVVKVTAYSPGRNGALLGLSLPPIWPKLPWIQTATQGFLALTRTYTLEDRDGIVYVGIKRWDEDHNPINFPNGHTLWQGLFHNTQAINGTFTGQDLMQSCNGLTLPDGNLVGFGLLPQTLQGLGLAKITPADEQKLANSFMLNDSGNGAVDPSAKTDSAAYMKCLQMANFLLAAGQESHICGLYMADIYGYMFSQDGDPDYTVKFWGCTEQPDDLTTSNNGP